MLPVPSKCEGPSEHRLKRAHTKIPMRGSSDPYTPWPLNPDERRNSRLHRRYEFAVINE